MAFATCNADCKKTNGPTSGQFVCGNTICESAENPTKCAADCPSAGGCPGSLLQWATSATASSQYSAGGWSAMQATGAPNTTGCGDISTAWAPSTSGAGVEWLRLVYATDAHATGFSIHETNVAGSVDQVEYIEPGGAAHVIWSASDGTACGNYLTITHAQTSYLVREVRVTTSLSGWEEIDAVRLLGFSP